MFGIDPEAPGVIGDLLSIADTTDRNRRIAGRHRELFTAGGRLTRWEVGLLTTSLADADRFGPLVALSYGRQAGAELTLNFPIAHTGAESERVGFTSDEKPVFSPAFLFDIGALERGFSTLRAWSGPLLSLFIDEGAARSPCNVSFDWSLHVVRIFSAVRSAFPTVRLGCNYWNPDHDAVFERRMLDLCDLFIREVFNCGESEWREAVRLAKGGKQVVCGVDVRRRDAFMTLWRQQSATLRDRIAVAWYDGGRQVK